MKLPPQIDEMDFSEAHFLDHPWWSCRGGPYRYGGMRGHLKTAWKYRWSEELRAATTCRLGRHRPVQAWKRDSAAAASGGPWTESFTVCAYCAKRLP